MATSIVVEPDGATAVTIRDPEDDDDARIAFGDSEREEAELFEDGDVFALCTCFNSDDTSKLFNIFRVYDLA